MHFFSGSLETKCKGLLDKYIGHQVCSSQYIYICIVVLYLIHFWTLDSDSCAPSTTTPSKLSYSVYIGSFSKCGKKPKGFFRRRQRILMTTVCNLFLLQILLLDKSRPRLAVSPKKIYLSLTQTKLQYQQNKQLQEFVVLAPLFFWRVTHFTVNGLFPSKSFWHLLLHCTQKWYIIIRMANLIKAGSRS